MNYNESIDWLYSFEKFGIKLGLDRIKYICNRLGNPQNNYKIVHVGGTNGKGSVCRFLQSILTLSGYKTGMYTSPHLQRFSERFVIDGNEITKEDITLLVERIKPIIDEMIEKDNTPTFFEIVTAMAFQYFSDKKVDFAIVEVGLGGRFDATNIVTPFVTIITNVSLEHQDRLGEKIEDIAFEKSGIIKQGVSVVTAANGSALEVIKKITNEKNAQITIVESNSWKKIDGGIDWQEFLINCSIKDYKLTTLMIGKYYGENIAITLATIEALQINGVYITDKSIYEGVEKVKNPGRMEIVSFEPIILLDGAHNVTGINSLKQTLEEDLVCSKLILVIGILSDKKVKDILDIIIPITDVVVVTKSHNKRACDPSKIKDMIHNKEVVIKEKIPNAVDYAKSIAEKHDLICITGSIFTVGEARNYLIK